MSLQGLRLGLVVGLIIIECPLRKQIVHQYEAWRQGSKPQIYLCIAKGARRPLRVQNKKIVVLAQSLTHILSSKPILL